jgi:hypothetical protein
VRYFFLPYTASIITQGLLNSKRPVRAATSAGKPGLGAGTPPSAFGCSADGGRALALPYRDPANLPIAEHHAPSPYRPVPDFSSHRPIYHRVSPAPAGVAGHGAGNKSLDLRCKRGRSCARQDGSASLVCAQGWNGSPGIHQSVAGHRYRATEHRRPPRLPSAADLPVNARRGWGMSWLRCGPCKAVGVRRDGCTGKHAMAVGSGRQGQRQVGEERLY